MHLELKLKDPLEENPSQSADDEIERISCWEHRDTTLSDFLDGP